MAKVGKILKFGYGVLDDLGFFSPTEKAIDALGQDKFPVKDLYRFEDDKPAGLLSKFGRPVQDEMVFTGLEDKILGLPEGSTVTSKELKDYLADNKTRVEEVIKSEAKQKEIFTPFNISRLDIDDGQSVSITGWLDDLTDDSPEALEAFAKLDSKPTEGTIDNPNVEKIEFDDLGMNFKTSLYATYIQDFQDFARKPELTKGEKLDTADKITKAAQREVETQAQNLVKFDFTDKGVKYEIKGNNNIGFEISAKEPTEDIERKLGKADSFNEAKIQINAYRRQGSEFGDIDELAPKHKEFTLPGGENYQEIILKMPEAPDNVANTLGKFDDVVMEDRFGGIINLGQITGSPSDVTLSPDMVTDLKLGNVVTIDTNRGTRKIQYNKEKDEVELLKTDYTNYSHTGDEENVVVFTRTKDRVDEDGRKILYVEEIQSDMSQQGRKKGLVMGQKEKKAFINRNNNAVFGDVLDSINALKDVSNIGDLKGVRKSTTEVRDILIDKPQPALQLAGFKKQFDNAFVASKDKVDYENAHSFEDIIKKHMTKYKFNELKDNQTRIFTNRGLDKTTVNQLDKKTLEDTATRIPPNLYDNVSDFVDINKFKEKIDAIETVLANKIYTKEFNKRPDMGSVAGKAEFDKLQAFNRDMLKKFMGEKEFNNFIKKETKSTIGEVLPFYITETPNDMGVVEFYNSIGDTDIIDVIPDENYKTTMTKAEFNEKYLFPDINRKVENRLQTHATVTDSTSVLADGFDYPENALDEVYDKIKDLQRNLGNAVKYDVKLRPMGNIPSAPFIGSTERFTELAVKRLLKHAKDNDYDGVAFSSGKIHEKRWNQPALKQYYDVIIPKVAKNILKGTDAKLEYTDIFLDQDSLDEAMDLVMNNKRYDYVDRDVNTELDRPDPLLGQSDGFRGYIGDTPTIYLTDDVKEYVDSGISLYTPITATGLAGAVTSKMLGSEEDIITEEGI